MVNFKKNPIVFGTLLLTASGLFCRGIGFFYRLFISHTFGEEGMGIFQLTAPVIMLAFSLSCAGMQSAISRLTAYYYAKKQDCLIKKGLLLGCVISLTLSSIYSIIIYTKADAISLHLLKEIRCAPFLRICSLSFPLSALHCCFNGYYYGRKKTLIPSLTQLAEQLVRVGSVFLLYFLAISKGNTPTISFTCIGVVLGEFISCIISISVYAFEMMKTDAQNGLPRKTPTPKNVPVKPLKKENHFSILKQICSMFIPLTFNRVLVNVLQSMEAISIPSALKQYGYASQTALSIYGVLTGMALSFILFPSTFTNSAAVLILPAVSEAESTKNKKQISLTIIRSILFSTVLGFGCFLFFYLFSSLWGNLLFNSMLAGAFIKKLSFLCPFLYLHITLSSILNGLKKSGTTLFISIISLVIRLLFIQFLIPLWGIDGYIYGILCSELLSALFCIWYLKPFLRFS